LGIVGPLGGVRVEGARLNHETRRSGSGDTSTSISNQGEPGVGAEVGVIGGQKKKKQSVCLFSKLINGMINVT